MANQVRANNFVEFAGVGKSYDGRTLTVENFDLQIAPGEFVTLLGPSGSGKTTCLKMLAGFESVTRGKIQLDGQPIDRLGAHKRNIGVVFQHYALFPHMTIAENLSFPLEVRQIPKSARDQAVKHALDMVQLQGFANRRPAQLSGGQQQRVAIARALVFEPQLVLMDEPLGALDRRLREEMQYEIRRIQQRLEVTVLYVTHDQGEAMALSDRVAVMHEGRIQQIAPPEILYEEPNNLFVANFIGENNRLDGRILSYKPDVCHAMVDNEDIKAFPVAIQEGDKFTSMAIRPERVKLNPNPDHYPNVFDARIEDIIFMGDHLRIHANLLKNRTFVVKIPNIIGHGAVLKGDTVKIGWLSSDCRALDPAPGSIQ